MSATTGAVATALGLKSLTKVSPHRSFIQGFYPIILQSWPAAPHITPRSPSTSHGPQGTEQHFSSPAPSYLGWQICALCGGGCCQLHQHPPDEAAVSGPGPVMPNSSAWGEPSPRQEPVSCWACLSLSLCSGTTLSPRMRTGPKAL